MLLVHGWGADRRSWDDFALGPEVSAPDLLGHGERADQADPGLTIGELVRDLVTDLVEPVVAIGHSMGGQVVTKLAVEHPSLVRAIVVIDPAYGADEAEMRQCPAVLADLRTCGTEAGVAFVDRAFAASPGAPVHKSARAQMSRTPGPVLADLYHSMYLAPDGIGSRPAAREYLTKLDKPCLSLYSTEYAADFTRSLSWSPGSAIEVWPGTTHYLHQEHPRRFARLVTSWLTTLDPGR